MSGSAAALASGSRVVLGYVREEPTCRGVTPAALSTPTSIGASDMAAATSGVYTRSDTDGSWITDGFAAGQNITVAGFTNAANNGTMKVVSVTATVLTTDATTTTEGTPPGATTFEIRMESFRSTSRQVNLQKNVLDSAEVRASGQRADSRHGFIQIVGQPGFQLSLQDFDDTFELALRNVWSTISATTPTTIEFTTVTAGLVTAEIVGADLVTEGYRPGDFITIASMATSANNGRYRLVSLTANSPTSGDTTVTMRAATDGAVPVVEGTAASATYAYPGRRIALGNTLTTWTVERRFEDITKYQPFRGCGANSLQLSISPEGIITGVLSILGLGSSGTDEGKLNATDLANSTLLAASSNAPFAAFDGSLFEGGTEIAVVTSLDFTVALNRSLEPVVGSKFSPDIFDGTAQVTGNMTAFLDATAAIYDKFVDEVESSLWFSAEAANQLTWINFVMPRVKFNGADIDPPQSGAIPQATPFEALEDSTYATAIWVQVSNAS